MHNDGITKVVARRFYKHNVTSIYSKFNRNITFSRKTLKNAAKSSTPPFLLFVIVFVSVSCMVNLKCYHHFHHHWLLILRIHSSISSLGRKNISLYTIILLFYLLCLFFFTCMWQLKWVSGIVQRRILCNRCMHKLVDDMITIKTCLLKEISLQTFCRLIVSFCQMKWMFR